MCPRVKSRSKAKSVQPEKLWILLVGVNQYQDTENLASLQYSALDCRGLGEALIDATASFSSKEVIIHHDFVSQRPQLAAVQQSIKHITQSAGQNDTILFYFSGHGILETKTQQVALCLADTDTKELLTTGLPLNDLLKQLGSCAASQQLVWLDACHSGGMTLRGTAAADPSEQLVEVLRHKASESKGFYALLSCDRAQQSWEFPELGHGVFTYYLMRGLRGEAADAGGIIEADALYQYVYHQTLRYIDKTNQQIRLINQQKSSRGENKLQSEFPIQTPKRIVEGFGKVVLGKRSQQDLDINPRQALVVDGGSKANSTTLALSQVLQSAGDFNLRYFPQTNEPWSRIKDAIASCLNAQVEDKAEISTALLYLRGEVETAESGTSWLVLADGMRISRFWLKKILQNARATQQIVILDCPGSDNLQDWVEDLRLEGDRGQCLIAANASLKNSSQFADLVLETLQSDYTEAGLPVAAWISKLQVALAGTGIMPQIWLSGTQGVIELLAAKNRLQNQQPVLDLGICPYMGLQAFDEAQSEYFYGRETLVQKLVNQINHQTAIAVVGASGSGKSSAVKAGLMTQLRQGQQIPNSDRWWLGCFRPGNIPVRALAQLLTDGQNREEQAQSQLQIEGLLYQGEEGFVRWLRSRSEPMVVLVIDQFEELYTLAEENDRREFLNLILGAMKHASDRFKLVLTIRADFVSTCLENPELGSILQKNSVLVPPYLTEADYRHAIVKPAQQVGLEVESGLVEVLLQDLDRSAGDLPLLQFALQQLWERRTNGRLTLEAYQQLEGVKGALERQAQQVYDSLDPQSQACARWIFLNLTQLGEGTEDTRRRITKSDLIVAKYPAELVNKTLRTLTDAKLLVVNLDSGSIAQSRSAANSPEDDELFLEAMRQEATVEVVHEILIRHWSSLRWWLEENRSRLRSQRQIEQAAILWLQKDRQDDFLLKGVRLAEAEEILIKYTDELSPSAKEFIASCIDVREAEQRAAKRRLRQAQLTATALGILGLTATVLGVGAYRQKLLTQVENITSLTSVTEAQLLSNQQLESLTTSVKAGRQFEQINGLSKLLVGHDNWQQTKIKTSATL
ncbi:MAG: caspase family protein, partial [Cyanobacteria bacterium J06600_6]